MIKLIALIIASIFVLLTSSKSFATFQCNEELLKMVASGCGDSQTACGARGLKNILAGRSAPEMILDMCSPQGSATNKEDPMSLFNCAEKALKVSSNPKLRQIGNRCSAKDNSAIHRLKVGLSLSEYEKCSRTELRKLVQQPGSNPNGQSATR